MTTDNFHGIDRLQFPIFYWNKEIGLQKSTSGRRTLPAATAAAYMATAAAAAASAPSAAAAPSAASPRKPYAKAKFSFFCRKRKRSPSSHQTLPARPEEFSSPSSSDGMSVAGAFADAPPLWFERERNRFAPPQAWSAGTAAMTSTPSVDYRELVARHGYRSARAERADRRHRQGARDAHDGPEDAVEGYWRARPTDFAQRSFQVRLTTAPATVC